MLMKVWDKEDRVWLERDSVDAQEMLKLYGDRYSKTETPSEPETPATQAKPDRTKK